MSKIISSKEQRIREKIDNIFGNSVAAQELKSIALKSALGELTEEDAKEYWRNKEEEIKELKERMPEVDLALPKESITIVGETLLSNIIMGEQEKNNGVSRQGETSRDKGAAIVYEI